MEICHLPKGDSFLPSESVCSQEVDQLPAPESLSIAFTTVTKRRGKSPRLLPRIYGKWRKREPGWRSHWSQFNFTTASQSRWVTNTIWSTRTLRFGTAKQQTLGSCYLKGSACKCRIPGPTLEQESQPTYYRTRPPPCSGESMLNKVWEASVPRRTRSNFSSFQDPMLPPLWAAGFIPKCHEQFWPGTVSGCLFLLMVWVLGLICWYALWLKDVRWWMY